MTGPLAAFVVRAERGVGKYTVASRHGPVTLWMIWPDTDERDQLIALLKGDPYPPTRTGSR